MRHIPTLVRRALAIAIPFLFLLTIAAQDATPTVDDIIQKHTAARGGLDKLKAVRSEKVTGKMVMMGGQMEAALTMRLKRPGYVRLEMEVQGKTVVEAYDGGAAWTINPFQGSGDPKKMGADETAEMASNSDFDGALIDYKAKGHTAELVGKQDLDGAPVYQIKLVKKTGKTEYHYIDARTFLEVKRTSKNKIMGNETDVDSYSSNYKPVNGIMIPFSVEQKAGGRSLMTMTIDKFEQNVPIDDAIFKMPDEKKAPAK